MQIINYPRAAGKTHRIVQMAIEHNYDILVFDQNERIRLLQTFRDLKPDQVFTMATIQSRKGRRDYNGTVVDNLDLIFQMMLPTPVKAITLTEPVIVAQSTKAAK